MLYQAVVSTPESIEQQVAYMMTNIDCGTAALDLCSDEVRYGGVCVSVYNALWARLLRDVR